MNVWESAFVIFLLSLTVLVYLAIPVMLKLRESLKKANKTMDILNKDLPDIMDNLSDISKRVNKASSKLETTVEDIAELEQLISKEIKQPLQNIAQSVATLIQLANKIFVRKSKK